MFASDTQKQLIVIISVVGLIVTASSSLGAQEKYMHLQGQARVSIIGDDLVSAKQVALKQAKQLALWRAIRRLVAPFWLKRFKQDIQAKIITNPAQYIVSFQATLLEPTLNRTRYLADVEIQADRLQLESALRDISLPLLSQPLRVLQPLYAKNDKALQHPEILADLIRQFSRKLSLLRFQLAKPRQLSQSEMKHVFRASSDKERHKILDNQLQKPLLLFMFSGSGLRRPARLDLLLLTERSASIVAQEQVKLTETLKIGEKLSASQRSLFLDQLTIPLATALVLKNVKLNTSPATLAKQQPLQLAVIGLKNLADEEAFRQLFFSAGGLFEGFALAKITARTIFFRGNYRGEPENLPARLNNRTFGSFIVKTARLDDDMLSLNLTRKQTRRHLSLTVLDSQTFAEVENNGWFDSANRLLLRTTISGAINARADADFFIGSAKESLTIIWQREGRTRIQPIIRIYDRKRNLLLQKYLSAKNVKFQTRLPKGSGKFYLEIADRFGNIAEEVGGYLNLNYRLQVF